MKHEMSIGLGRIPTKVEREIIKRLLPIALKSEMAGNMKVSREIDEVIAFIEGGIILTCEVEGCLVSHTWDD